MNWGMKNRISRIIKPKTGRCVRAELKDIREHMVDADTILTEEERNLVEESFKHEKQEKLVSLSDFKKKL